MSATATIAPGYRPWQPARPASHPSKALVLGGGGATGIAWMGGLFAELRDLGVDVRDADTMIGTSAGSVVGAHLRIGTPDEVAMARMVEGVPLRDLGRPGPRAAVDYARTAWRVDRVGARAVVGTSALAARTMPEETWIETVAADLVGVAWPQGRLLITAVDAESGTSVVFDRDSGVPLERAVAASCTVPWVFPPVTISGRRFIDGGVRTVANADLAAGHDRVLVVAPIALAARRRDTPAQQALRLRPQSRTLLLTPDRHSRRAIGPNPLDMRRAPASVDAGREQAHRVLDRVASLWAAQA